MTGRDVDRLAVGEDEDRLEEFARLRGGEAGELSADEKRAGGAQRKVSLCMDLSWERETR